MSNDTMPCGCEGHLDNLDLCRYPAEVERLTRERDEAHRDWQAELDGNAALRAKHGARPNETFFQFIARLADGHAAAESWKARAEAADADNAAHIEVLKSFEDDVWADRPGDAHRRVCLHLRKDRPGAALLERLRAAEKVVEAIGRAVRPAQEYALAGLVRIEVAALVDGRAWTTRFDAEASMALGRRLAYDAARDGAGEARLVTTTPAYQGVITFVPEKP